MEDIWKKAGDKALQKIKAQEDKVKERIKSVFKVMTIIIIVLTVIVVFKICNEHLYLTTHNGQVSRYILTYILGISLVYFITFLPFYLCNPIAFSAINKIFRKDYNEYYEADAQYLCTFYRTQNGLTSAEVHLCKLADGTYCTALVYGDDNFKYVLKSMPENIKSYIENTAPKLKPKRRVKIIAKLNKGKLDIYPVWLMY